MKIYCTAVVVVSSLWICSWTAECRRRQAPAPVEEIPAPVATQPTEPAYGPAYGGYWGGRKKAPARRRVRTFE